MEKVLVDSFFILKLKSVRVALSSYFLPLSNIISVSSFAHSLPSASMAYRTGTKVERRSCTALRFAVYLAILVSQIALCCSFVGSPLVLKCYSCLRKASTIGPSFASSFFKFWQTFLLASTSLQLSPQSMTSCGFVGSNPSGQTVGMDSGILFPPVGTTSAFPLWQLQEVGSNCFLNSCSLCCSCSPKDYSFFSI